ncbi:hypothetical protein ONZ45_g4929 [Pleurotus djamor]|nr:hypothetical protein ONZ45_g4929 [Pleurotus djamor]
MDCESSKLIDSLLAGGGSLPASTDEILLLLLKQQAFILSRMDQLQQSMHATALDIEDIRTGCLDFFDEYRLGNTTEGGQGASDETRRDLASLPPPVSACPHKDSESTKEPRSSYTSPRSMIPASPTLKPSLSPVNWSKVDLRSTPAHVPVPPGSPGVSSSYFDYRDSTLGVDGSVMSPSNDTTSRDPPDLPSDTHLSIPHPMPDFHDRRKEPWESPSFPSGSLEDPFKVDPILYGPHEPPVELQGDHIESCPSSPITPPSEPLHTHAPTAHSLNDSVPGEGSDDMTIPQYLNTLYDEFEPEHVATSPLRPTPSPGLARSMASSEADALLAETHLLQDTLSTPDETSQLDRTLTPMQRPLTVDPSDLGPLSPLTSLSPTPSSTPEPTFRVSTSMEKGTLQALSAPLVGRFGSKFVGEAHTKKHPAATRIRKRKNKVILDSEESESEIPAKRARLSDDESEAPVSWPMLTTMDNNLVRKVVCCDACLHWYHYGCVGILDKSDKRIKRSAVFLCPVCVANPRTALQRRPKKDDPPSVCSREDCNRVCAEYHVAGIIGKGISPSDEQIKWLIKWEGYSILEATWESEDAIADLDGLVAKFERAVKKERGASYIHELSPDRPLLLLEAEKAGW